MSDQEETPNLPVDPFVQILITDSEIDTDRMMLEGLPMDRSPTFSVSEVAKVFFARSDHWMRWRERKGFFEIDGAAAGTRTEAGARTYTLADAESVLHAAARSGAISGVQLLIGLKIVRALAVNYGILTSESMNPGDK